MTVTRLGPVISKFAADSGKGTVLSLQWTALEPSKELEASLITADQEKEAIDLLKNWNFIDHKDEAAPLIFNL